MIRKCYAVLFLAMCVTAAWAQEFPARPVKIIVPWPPGGLTDVIARMIGQRLTDARSSLQFVVENRPGAGGITAMVTAAKAAPDGYTLIIVDPAHTTINQLMFANLPYDTGRDFVPVTIVASGGVSVVINTSAQIDNFAQLIAYAKANPGRLNYGSGGIGSIHHLAMESIKASLGLDIVHVPYKGSGQSVPAFIAGEVQLVMSSLSPLAGHIKAGKARVLAVTPARRYTDLPDVPSVAEFIPGYDFSVAMGLLAPAGAPAAVVSWIAAETSRAIRHPESVSRLTSLGVEAVGSTPETYATAIRDGAERYANALKSSGAKLNQ